MNNNCKDCKAFNPAKTELDSGGHCHRHPPVFMIEQADPQDRSIMISGWYHPYVGENDWCMDFLETEAARRSHS